MVMAVAGVCFAGFGGQGIVTCGIVLGRAAAVHDGRYATQTQSYGPEARGGACRSEVVISDEPVDYPLPISVDVLIAMSQEGLERYAHRLKPGGLLLVDSHMVRDLPPEQGARVYRIAATRRAEELGRRIVANVVMLGAFAAVTDLVSPQSLECAVLEMVPAGTADLNSRAFAVGLDLGRHIEPEAGQA